MRSRLAAVVLLFAGCGGIDEPRVLSVIVRPGEPVTAADADDFLRLAIALGPDRLKPLADCRPDAVRWPPDSTRTVADLAAADRARLERELTGTALAAALLDDPTATRLLGELGWSAGRFASIGAALGVARTAEALPDVRELRRLRGEAERNLAVLAADGRVFGTLPAAERAAVMRRAAWVPRFVLLDALLAVPPGTRELVRERRERLAAVLPAGFDATALDRLLSDRERSAVPFHEPDPLRDDAALRWDGEEVVARPADG